ncbi:AAHS family 4-hydroxybenzoate transporter-like MFS transporter [Amycolatopsis bartoniae]|uniref:MFS transporter n=1 Tax=Amycolatopsis bartoniae TaxID=941986 RepID=A0A8H9M6U3_9PSEU|nr:aromatic acid/H+ symport family MFS transporter [Amycolatopsis bartoniae]MBB2936516.1 AAHS family 4-hydroxybenzoate transporter-like MFS transporter [Amycolatopsis bartoniae]TVT11008.1 aromatic acid/H+ symport family MFS transporter [Amycolatopsis bartoniae]GHF68380.1 MFS transporter [Amycolatopsis bartoniae]
MSATGTVDVRTVIDRNPLGRFQLGALFACLLCIVVDGLEVTVAGFLATQLKADWGVTTAQLAPAVTSGLAGLGVGSFVAGPLGDRFGRRTVIAWSIAVFAAATLLTALTTGVLTFSLLRLVTGLGLGASMPNVAALVTETVPTRSRRITVAIIWAGFPAGAAIGALAIPFVVAGAGWRTAIVLCGLVGVAILLVVLVRLPESPRFLANSGRHHDRLLRFCNHVEPGSAGPGTVFAREAAARIRTYPIALLLKRPMRTGTLTLWLGYMAVMFTVYLTNTWLPYLFTAAGFGTGEISLLTTLLQVGGVIGCAVIGLLQERVGPHRTLVLTSVLGAGMALLIAVSPRSTLLLATLIFVLGMCTNSISTGYTVISATFYPTDIRSTGTSWTAGMSRAGAVAGGGVGTALASIGLGFQQVFLLLLVPITIGALCMVVKGRAYRDRLPVPASAAPLTTTKEG